jgi:hypothetical protein
VIHRVVVNPTLLGCMKPKFLQRFVHPVFLVFGQYRSMPETLRR